MITASAIRRWVLTCQGRNRDTLRAGTKDSMNVLSFIINCSFGVQLSNFSILGSTNNELDLRILESLYIYKKRPSLNDQQSSYPLLIL